MSQPEELKPCPFCGGDSIAGECAKCEAYPLILSRWDSAYCWKRIDELEAQVKETKKMVEDYSVIAEKAVEVAKKLDKRHASDQSAIKELMSYPIDHKDICQIHEFNLDAPCTCGRDSLIANKKQGGE